MPAVFLIVKQFIMHSEELLQEADSLNLYIKNTFENIINKSYANRMVFSKDPLEINYKGNLIIITGIVISRILCEYKDDGDELFIGLDDLTNVYDKIKLIAKMENELIGEYEEVSKSIVWSTGDFNIHASELEQEAGPLLYDRRKFAEALEKMIKDHDCNYGINWNTVEQYLDEYCKL